MNKTLVVIAGPTAVGKTTCGIQIARHFDAEIISADSRQIYRETSIGTAVPSAGELALVKHHFIQTISIQETYNASTYEHQVLDTLQQLFEKHNLVIMAGGSGLYIDAVCKGIDDLPTTDPLLRKSLLSRLEKEGLATLTLELKKLDPVSYESPGDLPADRNTLFRFFKSCQKGSTFSHHQGCPGYGAGGIV